MAMEPSPMAMEPPPIPRESFFELVTRRMDLAEVRAQLRLMWQLEQDERPTEPMELEWFRAQPKRMVVEEPSI
jgi:hypothetical protein